MATPLKKEEKSLADRRREGFNYVTQALELEEKGVGRQDPHLVISLYRLGIAEWHHLKDSPEETPKVKETLKQIRQRIRDLRDTLPKAQDSPLKSRPRPPLSSSCSSPSSRSQTFTRNSEPESRSRSNTGDKKDESLEGLLKSSIVNLSDPIRFKDVIGQEKAKEALRENVIYPALRYIPQVWQA